MNEKRMGTSKGIVLAMFVMLGNGFLPVINNARPKDLGEVLFTFMTILIEMVTIFPVVLIEQHMTGLPLHLIAGSKDAWRKYWKSFVCIGILFAIATYFLVFGLSSTDSTTGAVAMKTMPISAVFMGYFYLHEKITWQHVACIVLMFVGIIFVATKGTWQLNMISPGVIFVLIAPVLWTFGHTLSKIVLVARAVSASQMIVIRTAISGAVLGSYYIIGMGGTNAWQIVDPGHFLFMLLMGVNYALIIHYCWYKAISCLDLNFATSLGIPSPLITALLAIVILGEPFEWYHVIGMAVAFIGLYGIILLSRRSNDAKKHAITPS